MLQDAVKNYAGQLSWAEFAGRNEKRALTMGLTEEDVPRLIEEYRNENRSR